MRVLRVLFGIALGLALAAGLLRALAFTSNELVEAVQVSERDDIRMMGLGLALLGAVLAVITMIGRHDPAITITCALGVLAPVGPAFVNNDLPNWAPSWVLPDQFVVLAPVYPLVAGVLVVAAAWGVGAKARTGRHDDDVEPWPDDARNPRDMWR